MDSCAFDSDIPGEEQAATKLLKINQTICEKFLIIAHSTGKEIGHPNTPVWVKQESSKLIWTSDLSLAPAEINILRKIESILAGNGKVAKIKADAQHIFECHKYAGRYFVTTDRRIHKKKEELKMALGKIDIIKPTELLAKVTNYIELLRNDSNPYNAAGDQ